MGQSRTFHHSESPKQTSHRAVPHPRMSRIIQIYTSKQESLWNNKFSIGVISKRTWKILVRKQQRDYQCKCQDRKFASRKAFRECVRSRQRIDCISQSVRTPRNAHFVKDKFRETSNSWLESPIRVFRTSCGGTITRKRPHGLDNFVCQAHFVVETKSKRVERKKSDKDRDFRRVRRRITART